MIDHTTITQLTKGMPNNELPITGLAIPQINTTGLGGLGAIQHGSPKGNPSVPQPGDGAWVCYKCKTRNEEGRLICKTCGTRN